MKKREIYKSMIKINVSCPNLVAQKDFENFKKTLANQLLSDGIKRKLRIFYANKQTFKD